MIGINLDLLGVIFSILVGQSVRGVEEQNHLCN